MLCLAALVIGWIGAAPPAVQGQAGGELATLVEPIRARHGVPALGVAVVALDGTARVGVSGVRAQGSPVAAEAADRFHLGSCTKSMTATLAALLVERGSVDWDTTPADVFGERFEVDPAWEEVTLELLLAHRAGVVRDANPLLREGEVGELRVGLAEELLFAPPQGEPDSATSYSNAGYVLAGAMLEAVTDTGWEELMRAELFEPLGMTSAGFGAPDRQGSAEPADPLEPRQPFGHGANRKPEAGFDNPAYYGPCGTVHASLEDWCRYLAEHLRGAAGEGRLLEAESYARLHRDHGGGYGLGWGVTTRPWAGVDGDGVVLTHAGSNTRWYCVVWMAPERGFAAVAAANWASDRARAACDEAVWAAIAEHIERAAAQEESR